MVKRRKTIFDRMIIATVCLSLCIAQWIFTFAADTATITGVRVNLSSEELNVSSDEQTVTATIDLELSGGDTIAARGANYKLALPEGWTLKSYTLPEAAAIQSASATAGMWALMSGSTDVKSLATLVIGIPAGTPAENYSISVSSVKVSDANNSTLFDNGTATTILKIKNAETSATNGYTVALSSDAPAEGVAKGEPFNINLNVSNTEATTFNAFSGILTYDKTKVSYTGNGTIDEFGVENDSDAGTLKITRANQDVDISKDPDLSLPFKAEAAGDAVFELTSASVKVDEAANAEGQDAPAAAVEGSPLTVKVLETYTITFAGGEGATGTAPTKDPVPAGTKIELPDNTFTKEGWTFSKWSDGSSEYAEKAEYTMPAANVTFTAQWTEDIAVTPASANPTAYFGSQYKLIAATINASGYVPTYDDNEMFQVQGYDDNTWYYVIDGTYDSSKFDYTAGTGVTIQKPDNDVNQTGIVDINDAQFVYNIYNGTTPTQNIVQRLLLADTNRDKTVNTQDCAVVVQAI